MGQLGEPEATREARSPGATRGNIGESMGLPGKLQGQPEEPGATRGNQQTIGESMGQLGEPAEPGEPGAVRSNQGN